MKVAGFVPRLRSGRDYAFVNPIQLAELLSQATPHQQVLDISPSTMMVAVKSANVQERWRVPMK